MFTKHLRRATGVALLAVAVSGTAVAASSTGTASSITGCVSKHGAIRILASGRTASAGGCRRAERKLAWNQVGPRGPQGLPGPRGPQGVQGVQGATGPQGPGAIERTYSIQVNQQQSINGLGPFSFLAVCGKASSGNTLNTLLAANDRDVTYDATSISSGDIQVSNEHAPATATPIGFDVISGPFTVNRHGEDTITSPAASAGQLSYTIGAGPGGCTGSFVFIPAAIG